MMDCALGSLVLAASEEMGLECHVLQQEEDYGKYTMLHKISLLRKIILLGTMKSGRALSIE